MSRKAFASNLKPGTYYFGDPCYVFDIAQWDKIGKLANGFRDLGEGPFKLEENGPDVGFCVNTCYGDGTYPISVNENIVRAGNLVFEPEDEKGFIGVDAGLIGVVDMAFVKKEKADLVIQDGLGYIIVIDKETYASGVEGVLSIEGVAFIDSSCDGEDPDEFDEEFE